jgi:transcriptional regulator with XRE-family HTH domain
MSKINDQWRKTRVRSLSPTQLKQRRSRRAVWEIGLWLENRRVAMGMSQSELAEKTGVQQADISRYEHLEMTPSLETLVRLLIGLESEIVLKEKGSNKVEVRSAKKLAKSK